MTDIEGQQHFDGFFEEVFIELEEKVAVNVSMAAPHTCTVVRRAIEQL